MRLGNGEVGGVRPRCMRPAVSYETPMTEVAFVRRPSGMNRHECSMVDASAGEVQGAVVLFGVPET